jgi:hypothetical protein
MTSISRAERKSSPAAAAGEALNPEKPQCRRGQVQRLVRRLFADNTKLQRRLAASNAAHNRHGAGFHSALITRKSKSNRTTALDLSLLFQKQSDPSTHGAPTSAHRPNAAMTSSWLIPALIRSTFAFVMGGRAGDNNGKAMHPQTKTRAAANP